MRFSAAIACSLGVAWLGSAAAASAGEVMVLMSAPVQAYEQALVGFKDGLRSEHEIIVRQMDGSVERGRQFLASSAKPDLVFAIGVWALQAALDQHHDAPVVYAMVLNPASLIGKGAIGVTGASMNVPVADNMRLLRQLGPSVRRVGVVFNESKTGYLMREARELAGPLGIDLIARNAETVGEAIQAFDALQREGIDAFWYLPDETLLAPTVTNHVFLASHRSGIPILGISERQAEMGALLALTFASSEDIGRQAGELARIILEGKKPSEVPPTAARLVSLTVNLKAARKLGVEIPQSILATANELIQ